MSLGAQMAALEMARAIRIVVLDTDAALDEDGRAYADAHALPGEEALTVELAAVDLRRLPRAGEAWLVADAEGDLSRAYLLAPLPRAGQLDGLLAGVLAMRARAGESLELAAPDGSASLSAGQDILIKSGQAAGGSAASVELASGKVKIGTAAVELVAVCADALALMLDLATQTAAITVASLGSPPVNAPAITAVGAQITTLKTQLELIKG